MSLFSERYGYKPSEVIIRERMTPEIQNAICSCFDILIQEPRFSYSDLTKQVWVYFLNQRLARYDYRVNIYDYRVNIITKFIEDEKNEWYRKIDLVEFVIKFLFEYKNIDASNKFIERLNSEFERLNFAYRVVENKIVPIASKEEIRTIENAIENSENNVAKHLNKALEQYALRPQGDYQNSIKESISAVEAYLREKTDKKSFKDALDELKKVNINIPKILYDAFTKLYAYTNQPETGIRHALMDTEGNYVPTEREAYFMLVSCSAFINYLQGK